jgi:uncharacterized protein (TIGR00730 family)
VAGAGAALVASAPSRPGFGTGPGPAGFDDVDREESADLVAGQGDQPGWCGPFGALLGGDNREQGVRDHREQRPAPPGGPAADLVLVEPGQALPSLEGLLDRPATPGDSDQLAQRYHLAAEGIRVVYGGANVGTMGALADGVLQAGGEVVGVIPKQLVGNAESAHEGLSEIHFVESMHERKALMAELSDGFIALPGGLGTLEEFAEVVTWSQVGLHRKPTGLLNVAGYYDSLLRFLDHAVGERFLREQDRALVLSESRVRPLLDLMRSWEPAPEQQWMPAELPAV